MPIYGHSHIRTLLCCSVDLSVLREASEVQKTSIVLSLALLESSADDSQLCQGLLAVLLQVTIIIIIIIKFISDKTSIYIHKIQLKTMKRTIHIKTVKAMM